MEKIMKKNFNFLQYRFFYEFFKTNFSTPNEKKLVAHLKKQKILEVSGSFLGL